MGERDPDLVRELQEKNRELERRVEAAERATAHKSSFVSAISHELRTPLNGLLGMLDLLLGTGVTDEQREYLRLAHDAGDALLVLVNDLLDIAKIEAGHVAIDRVPFRLRDTVDDVLKLLGVKARDKGLGLAAHVHTDVPDALLGDPGRLRQILVNLIGNATKFSDKGDVVVSVDVEALAGDALTLHLAVRDQGIGIEPGQRDRIFEAFAQADESIARRYGGTGLGLTICARLAALMNGRVWLESEVGAGSTFHVTVAFTVDVHAPKLVPLPRARSTGRRVLVLRDPPAAAEALVHQLRDWGHDPVAADPSAVAAEVARAAGDRPFALVMIDASGGSVDVFALSEELHRAISEPPPIIVTGALGQPGDGGRARAAQIAAFLTRPTSSSDLHDAISTLLAPARPTSLVTRHLLREARRSFHVLVAEDNDVNRTLAVLLLEKRGHTVTAVPDGAEALAALTAGGFDVVLLDMQMPRLDGIEVIAGWSAPPASRRSPVVAVTANAQRDERRRAFLGGMDAFLAKPYAAHDLYGVVDTLGTAARERQRAGKEGVALVVEVEETVERFDGNRALFERVLRDFAASAPERVCDLWEAIDGRDAERARRMAHGLRGASSTLGLARVADQAHRIEVAAERDDMPSTRAPYWRLHLDLATLHRLLVSGAAAPAGAPPAGGPIAEVPPLG